LWEIVYIAKNLKAFYLPADSGWEEEVKLLKRRFRYRRVGVVCAEQAEGARVVEDPLYPIGPRDIPHTIAYTDVPSQLALVLPFSSLFMVPILASPAWRDVLARLLLWSARLHRPLTPSEFRFNLRVLTYFSLDLAVRCERQFAERVSSSQWGAHVEKRCAETVKDAEKRFWRLREDGGEGPTRLGIIEPLRHISEPPAAENIPFLLPTGVIFLEG